MCLQHFVGLPPFESIRHFEIAVMATKYLDFLVVTFRFSCWRLSDVGRPFTATSRASYVCARN